MLKQKEMLNDLSQQYPYVILIELIRTTSLDGEYPKPYLAKTFESAYEFAISHDLAPNVQEYNKRYFSVCTCDITKENKCYNCFCDASGTEYYVNDLDTSQEINKVWQSKNIGLYYECIIKKSLRNLSQIFPACYRYVKPRSYPPEDNKIQMYYNTLIKINDNVIQFGERTQFTVKYNDEILLEILTQKGVSKILNYNKFLELLKTNETFHVANEYFEQNNFIFQELFVFR